MSCRILFVGGHDWANCSHRVARAINQFCGELTARVCTAHPHPFGYREDMILDRGDLGRFQQAAATAEWIVTVGDGDYAAFDEMLRLALARSSDVRYAALHVGSAYRQNHSWYDQEDMRRGFCRRFLGADLFRFAEDDPFSVPYMAPCEHADVAPRSSNGSLRVAHSPSSRSKKGTEEILAALDGLPGVEIVLIENLPYEACVAQRATCQVAIDQINLDVGGFGMSSIESLAAGCVTLADVHYVSESVWSALAPFMSPPPILDIRCSEDIRDIVYQLAIDERLLARRQQMSRHWAATDGSCDSVAKYFLHQFEIVDRRGVAPTFSAQPARCPPS